MLWSAFCNAWHTAGTQCMIGKAIRVISINGIWEKEWIFRCWVEEVEKEVLSFNSWSLLRTETTLDYFQITHSNQHSFVNQKDTLTLNCSISNTCETVFKKLV